MYDFKMRQVAKDIIDIKIPEETKYQLLQLFFNIMQKYKICRGEDVGNGIIFDNPEWTACLTLFLQRIQDDLNWSLIFKNLTPDNIIAYPTRKGKKNETTK